MTYSKGTWKAKGLHIMITGKVGSQGQANRQKLINKNSIPGPYVDVKDDHEALANAKLMAAAPDLYESLHELLNYYNHPIKNERELKRIQTAQAALDKAKY